LRRLFRFVSLWLSFLAIASLLLLCHVKSPFEISGKRMRSYLVNFPVLVAERQTKSSSCQTPSGTAPFASMRTAPTLRVCQDVTRNKGNASAVLYFFSQYPTSNLYVYGEPEVTWENVSTFIAAARLTIVRLRGLRTIRVFLRHPCLTDGSFGCRLDPSRRKAVDVVSTCGLLWMGSQREATTFSKVPAHCCTSVCPRYPSKEGGRMPDTSRTAYLFQCKGEDLYAVSHDIIGGNIPRLPCTQGWRLCEEFQLGPRMPVPAPILPSPS
jgi:hypothetical protein